VPLLHLPVGDTAATSVEDFLLAWQLEPLPLLVLLVVGGLHLVGRRRLSRRGDHAERGRAWAFAAGWTAAALALLSPLHSYAEELFAVHMAQHLLLISVAAPLLLLANPMPAVLWGLSPGLRAAAGRALAPDGAALRALKLLTRPPLAWCLFVFNLWIWHLPVVYQAALGNEPLHYLQHATFFGTAVLFWWPVIGPAPLRSRMRYTVRMLYVFLAWLPNSLLGALLTFSEPLAYYQARPRHWGLDAMTDQQLAGLLMWIPGDLVYAAAMLALLRATVRQEDQREARTAASR
jgi:cytochrome c oxidase assembly factor CtaG